MTAVKFNTIIQCFPTPKDLEIGNIPIELSRRRIDSQPNYSSTAILKSHY